MKKNKNNNLILVIVLLIILICVIGMIIKKVIDYNSNDNEITQTQEENIQLSINDPLVQDLYTYVDTKAEAYSTETNNFTKYIFENNKLTNETFDNKQLYIYSFEHIDKNKIVINSDYDNISIPRDAYEKAIKKVFNIKPIFDPTLEFSFVLLSGYEYTGGFNFYYNSETDAYVSEVGMLGATPSTFYRKLVNAYKNNDDIVLEEKFIFIDVLENGGYSVCLDSSYNNCVKTELEKSILDITMDMYEDIANTITYTFKLGEDNEYHYYSSEIER